MAPSKSAVLPGSRIILMVDDDADDQYLAAEALKDIESNSELRTLNNGAELLQYLRRQGPFSDRLLAPVPDLILLDLNMPNMDGYETLAALRSDENLRTIPVVIFSTSRSPSDIEKSYREGANTYIAKPQSFEELCRVMERLSCYWFDTAERVGVEA